MITIRDIMQTRVVTVEVGQRLGRARELMDLHGISHLPVVSRNELVGILSLRDVWTSRPYDRTEEVEWTDDIPVERVMSGPVSVLEPEATVASAITLLRRRGFGCIPIVENGALVGIVTRADLRFVVERDFSMALEDGSVGPPTYPKPRTPGAASKARH